jgi:L-fuconolactonase
VIVDSHAHLWGESVAKADWLASRGTESLRRHFTIADYSDAAAGVVDAVVIVTAEQSERETRRLLDECGGCALVAGVVGWVELGGEMSDDLMERLVGIRHSVVSESADWLDRPEVRRGIRGFARSGRVFELLVAARDLPGVIRCAQENPTLRIVVDHLGNPPQGTDAWRAWRQDVLSLSGHDNVRMKMSGDGVRAATVEVALESFGPNRLMFGSDWPVSLLRRPLSDEVHASKVLTESLSSTEGDWVFGGTAAETYGLVA